jgi:hypothetical protein
MTSQALLQGVKLAGDVHNGYHQPQLQTARAPPRWNAITVTVTARQVFTLVFCA